jgi:hypothetical protein
MAIEIVEPEGDGVLLHKHGSKVLIWCWCDGGTRCPQGKINSETRCRIWIERSHLSEEGIERQKKMNRFDR